MRCLRVTPVEDLKLSLLINGISWRQVENLADSGPEDPVFTVCTTPDGKSYIRFGDGTKGKLPTAGLVTIRARYRAGSVTSTTEVQFRPEGNYTGIRMQVGRVLLDQDLNENSPSSRQYFGIFRGVVVSNRDPMGLMRLQVKMPVISDDRTFWALPCVPPGSRDVPTAGEAVWILFETGDPDHPVWIGVIPDRK
jgi:hypothetical protein